MRCCAAVLLLPILIGPTLLAAAVAQDPGRTADKTAAKAPFVFEAGVIELRTLITRCGSYLQRNILIDDRELAVADGQGQRLAPQRPVPQPPPAAGAPAGGAPAAKEGPTGPFVELQLPVVTDRDGCEELLTSLLWARGLSLVPLDEQKGVYEVLAMAGNRRAEIQGRAVLRTPEQVLARPNLRQYVTVACPLRHTNPNMATNTLRAFFNNQFLIGNVGNSPAVVLSGPQDQIVQALRLLTAADVPPQQEQRPELEARLDALTRQNEALAKRLEALESKLATKQ
jgi:hypothetical protein